MDSQGSGLQKHWICNNSRPGERHICCGAERWRRACDMHMTATAIVTTPSATALRATMRREQLHASGAVPGTFCVAAWRARCGGGGPETNLRARTVAVHVATLPRVRFFCVTRGN